MNFYFTNENAESVGPVSREQLQKLVDAGVPPPDSQACYEGSEEWG